MKLISLFIIFSLFNILVYAGDTAAFRIRLSADSSGLGEMSWRSRNYIDSGSSLGSLQIDYKLDNILYKVKTEEQRPEVLTDESNHIALKFSLPQGLLLTEQFSRQSDNSIIWNINFDNKSTKEIIILNLSSHLPIGKFDKSRPVPDNLNQHTVINGNASFCYWIPYSGTGSIMLMTMQKSTSLEYMSKDNNDKLYLYTNAASAMDTVSDTWRIPASSLRLPAGKSETKSFKFQVVNSLSEAREALYENGSLDVRIAPGMTIPNNLSVSCLVRSKSSVKNLSAEYPADTKIKYAGKKNNGYEMYTISFSRLGENMITVQYGSGKKAYLNFFSTESLETLIKKRAHFITTNQQIKDTSKWYNGLYSIWDMKDKKLLSPDDKGPFPDFVVGGSDDPSNSKPIYVSEKNVVYPDSSEIASLEYYEKNFVWGGLQRRDDEYPYPYGIYGSENWHDNRSGKVAGYNSGGSGKERMWRTFDYTTHLAIYYNLYQIAKNNPDWVHYLTAQGYLERAFRTAMAFFQVPYNIEMGKQWSFHGWTDWAYKQGNFHERYIVDIITALVNTGEPDKADLLRREWEKKVKYFIYDDPWPFGSEFETDRTAFESSFYIAKYAEDNELKPQEQLWYDKNKKVWYSHLHISDSATDAYMEKQLHANLALRGIIEPGFNSLGTAWSSNYGLDYMSQMGGVAILDYGIDYSHQPAEFINIGYNSLLSSWALMNTGNKRQGYGYWYPDKQNDGAVGWIFTPWQHSTTYFKNIPEKRWVWEYDGEIDHGLVGAIHGSASVAINDPLFGLTCYGCSIQDNKTNVILSPQDGVRQKVFLLTDNKRIGITLTEDGFAKDSVVSCSKAFDHISFVIENRQSNPHTGSFEIENLIPGTYTIECNDKLLSTLIVEEVKNMRTVKVPVLYKTQSVTIRKQ